MAQIFSHRRDTIVRCRQNLALGPPCGNPGSAPAYCTRFTSKIFITWPDKFHDWSWNSRKSLMDKAITDPIPHPTSPKFAAVKKGIARLWELFSAFIIEHPIRRPPSQTVKGTNPMVIFGLTETVNILTLVHSSVASRFWLRASWFSANLPGWTSWNFGLIFLHVIKPFYYSTFPGKLTFIRAS